MRKNRVEVECDNCGKTLHRQPSSIKNKVFCDKTCMGEFHENKIEIECDNCSSTLYKVKSEINDTNFCDKKCRGEYLSKRIKMECEECGDAVTRRPSTAGKTAFCSKECQLNHLTTDDEEKTYPSAFNKELKKEIRRRDLYSCQICGISQEICKERHNTKLDIHHMDEDKTNNNPENLVSLCRSCHGSMKKPEQAEKLKSSKDTMGYKKGYRRENQCKNLLKDIGFEAERSHNPAYSSGDYFGLFDVIAMRSDRKPRLIQVKSNSTGGALKSILESEFIPDTHFEVEVWVAHDNEGWRVKRMNGGSWDTIIDERDSDKNYGEHLKEKYE